MWRYKRFALIAASLAIVAVPAAAQTAVPTAQTVLSALRWRNVGPGIGGRSVAIDAVPGNPFTFYFGGVDGGVWRSRTTALPGRILPTASSMLPTASARSRSHHRIQTSSMPARARPTSATRSSPATVCTRRPTPARPGTTRACGTRTRSRRSSSIRAMRTSSTPPRWGTFTPNNAERGIFKSTDGGATLEQDALRRRSDRRDRPRDGQRAPEHAVCLNVAGVSHARGGSNSGGPGSGLYKIDRRRRALGEDLHQSRFPDRRARAHGRERRAKQSEGRVRDRAGERGRRLPLGRRRRQLEARERQHGDASARLLLHGDLRRPDRTRHDLRARTRRVLCLARRRQALQPAASAARRQSHRVDRPARPEDYPRGNDGGATVSVDRRRNLEQRAQSADRAVLPRRARRSVSVRYLRRAAGRRFVRRAERHRRAA